MSWDLKSKEDTFVGCELGICSNSVVLDRSASLLELVLILQMEGSLQCWGSGVCDETAPFQWCSRCSGHGKGQDTGFRALAGA